MISEPRRRKGFSPAGRVDPSSLGLSLQRTAELRLMAGFRRAAGEALAQRATVVVRRGVLEIRASDGIWHRAFEPLVARIAARVASDAELAIRAWRLIPPGAASAPAVRLARLARAAGDVADPPGPTTPAVPRLQSPPTEPVDTSRLTGLARRYLGRQKP